jgi:hypothetical protein
MNKEQQALLGEAYEGYVESYNKGNASGIQLDNGTKRVANIDEFIRRIRQDIPFAKKWGLKIEERELSLEERYDWFTETHHTNLTRSGNQYDMEDILNSNNCPTKSITVTYNTKTITSYE